MISYDISFFLYLVGGSRNTAAARDKKCFEDKMKYEISSMLMISLRTSRSHATMISFRPMMTRHNSFAAR